MGLEWRRGPVAEESGRKGSAHIVLDEVLLDAECAVKVRMARSGRCEDLVLVARTHEGQEHLSETAPGRQAGRQLGTAAGPPYQ